MKDAEIARLMAKKAAIDARLKLAKEKKRSVESKKETRRKILAGAAALEWAARDSEFSIRWMSELDRFFTREADRALFSLPPERTSHSEGIDRESPKLVVTNM